MSKKMIATAVACGLILSGCGATTQNSVSGGDIKEAVAKLPTELGTLSGLAALPSDSPDGGYESGGGGLTGEAWPVWGLPGARGPQDQGISTSKMPVASTVSLRPVFTALPGKSSYEFVVMDTAGKNTLWDSGSVSSSTSDCVINDNEASCTLPADKAGLLTNGSTYRLVTTADGITNARLFQVSVPQGTTGGTGAGVMGRRYQSAIANMQVGISFSTADQGAVAGSAATDGARWGLPAGWEWQGPGTGFLSIQRSSAAAQYSGFTELLTISSQGQSQTLGCKPTSTGANTYVCGALSGDFAALGYAATIDANGTVVVTSPGSGQNWTFNGTDQLVASSAAGTAPVTFTYRTSVTGSNSSPTALLDTMSIPALGWTWRFHYSGDAECNDQDLPSGFVSTPSGYSCGWTEPGGDHSSILYTQPDGAKVPRISRVINTPPACQTWQNCDQTQLGVFDLGWNSMNQIDWQRQDAIVDAAVLGAIDPSDNNYWSQSSYDDLGRVQSVRQPLQKPDTGGGNGAVGGGTDTFQYQPADSRWAPATHQVVHISSLKGSPTHTTIIAVDDAGRPQFKQDPDGVISEMVWDENLSEKYAEIVGNTVQSTTFDSFHRPVANYSGSTKSFDLNTCAPNAANRSNKSCQPVNDAGNPALGSQAFSYDDAAATGNGLRARYFSNAEFTGNPVSVSDTSQKGTVGFPISAPSGASDKWGVQLSGGVVLNQAGTWNIDVDVPKNMFTAGTLFVDGSVCAVLAPGATQATCTVTSDGSTYPIELDLANDGGSKNSGNVAITLQTDQFSPPDTGNDHFLPIWGAKASSTITDHNPDGSAVNQKTTYSYDNPITTLPTSTTVTPTKSGPHQPAKLVSTADYAANGFGGAFTTATGGPSGTKRTATYWGVKDTPKSVSLPNIDQLPADIQNTPQNGLLQVQTSPSGHQEWTVFDKYGIGVCQASVQRGVDPAWSCQQRDGRGRLVSAVARGQDGQPDINLTYNYRFDSNQDGSPFVATATRTEAGKTTTEVTREWPSGLTDSYTGDDGSTTSYTYTSGGTIASSATVIPTSAAADLVPMIGGTKTSNQSDSTTTLTYTYSYDDLGRPSTVADQSGELAKINYDSANPRQVDSYDYLGGKFSQQVHTDQFGRDLGQTWKLPGGDLNASATTTATGRTLSDQFDNVNDTYTYDGYGRLLQADTKVDQTTHSFTYSWDDDSQRTCAAVDIANPKQADCNSLTGATTFTYKDNQLVSSSAASSKIPADPLNKDGSYKQIGTQTYQYDAARQLTSAADSSATTPAAPAPSAPAASNPASSAAEPGSGDQAADSVAGAASPSGNSGDSAQPSANASAPGSDSAGTPDPASSSSASAGGTSAPAGDPTPTATPTPSPAQPAKGQEVRYLRDSANRPVAQTVTTANGTTGFSYVYAQAGTGASPIATVGQDGAVIRMVTLPGGLVLQGNSPMIPAPAGNALVKLNADGSRAGQAPGVWGPYGEQLAAAGSNTDAPNVGWRGQTSVLGGTLMVLGARAYRSDVASFLQPDPIPGGSTTSNDYAYVGGDPVNSADLTGTMSEVWSEVLGNLLSMMGEFFVLEGVYHIVDLFPESFWTVWKGALSKAVTFGLNAGVNLTMSVGLESLLHGEWNDMSAGSVIFAGISAAVSGYMGSSFAALRNKGLSFMDALRGIFKPPTWVSEAATTASSVVEDVAARVDIAAGQLGEGNVQGALAAVTSEETAQTIMNTATNIAETGQSLVESVRTLRAVGTGATVGGALFGPAGAAAGAAAGYVYRYWGTWGEWFMNLAEAPAFSSGSG